METLNLIKTSELINQANLVSLLINTTKSTTINLTYLVDDRRSKQVKGVYQLQKLVNIKTAYLNHDYQNKINNILKKEDKDITFIAEAPKGKTRVSSTILQSDSTKELMIDAKVLNSEVVEVIAYFHNGNEITEISAVALDLFTKAYYEPKKSNVMGKGTIDIENNFYIINTYISKIKNIKLMGVNYDII